MSHLGERVTPYVDGRLAPDAVDRITAHLAGCRPCRDVVELERLTKQRLVTLADPAVGDALRSRLLDLAGPAGPVPPRTGHVPGSPRTGTLTGVGRPVPRRDPVRPMAFPGPRSSSGRSTRTRVAAVMVGAACLVGVGVAGGSAVVTARHAPRVDPPVADFMQQHSATTGSLPFNQTAMLGAGARR